jgi:hypothetical protein
LKKFLSEGKVLEKPPNCADEIYELMRKCWKLKPSSRIDFRTIIDKLEKMLTKVDEEFLGKFKENSFVSQEAERQKKLEEAVDDGKAKGGKKG